MGRDAERAQRRGVKLTKVSDLPARWNGSDAGHRGPLEVAQEKSGQTAPGEEAVMEKVEKRYIARIETNIKGVTSHVLGPKVLVKGPNGSGKSSLVDTFSIVTTGQARSPGIGKGLEIKARGSADGRPAFITAETSDGEVLSWPSADSDTGLSISTWDVLYGAPEALQHAILSAMEQEIPAKLEPIEDLRSRLSPLVPQAYAARMESDVLEAVQGGTLVACLDAAKAVIDAKLKQVRAKLRAAKSAQAESNEPLSPEELDLLERVGKCGIKSYDTEYLEPLKMLTIANGRALRDELAGLKERLGTLDAQTDFEALRQELQEIERGSRARTLGEAYGINVMLQSALVDAGSIKCPCCGGVASREQIAGHGLAIEQRLTALSSRQASIRAQFFEHDELTRSIEQKESALTIAREVAKMAIDLLALAPDGDERRSIMQGLERRRSARQLSSDAYDDEIRITRDEQFLVTMQGAVQAVSARVVQGAGETPDGLNLLDLAAARVNRLLPPSIRVTFEMAGDHGCTTRVSIGGRPPTAFRLLGGAERALAGAAIASSFMSGPCKSLVIDEVWLLRPAVTSLLSLLDQAVDSPYGPGQVIVSVAEYGGTVPEGWTVIDLGPVRIPKAPSAEDAPVQALLVGDPPDPSDPFFTQEVVQVASQEVEQAPADPMDLESIDETTPIPPPPPARPEPPVADEDSPLSVYSPEMEAMLRDVKRIGSIQREEGQDPVPLFWLGLHKRLSQAGKDRLKQASDPANPLPKGTLGVALVGAKRSPRIVSLYGAVVQDASVSPDAKKLITDCALVHFTSIVSK